MTREIEPLRIPPDEAAREFVREMIVAAEASGRIEVAYPHVRAALYESWELIDRLRAALGGEATEG